MSSESLFPSVTSLKYPSKKSCAAFFCSLLLPTFAHGKFTLKFLILCLQVFVGDCSPLKFLAHRIIGIQESLNGLKKIVYLLLILFTFHSFRIHGAARLCRLILQALDLGRLILQELYTIILTLPKKGLDAYTILGKHIVIRGQDGELFFCHSDNLSDVIPKA